MPDNIPKDILANISDQAYIKTGGIVGKRRGTDWPQSTPSSKGYLPPDSITPRVGGDDNADNAKLSEFGIKDWRGKLLDPHPDSDVYDVGVKDFTTLEKLELSKIFPVSSESKVIESGYVNDPSEFTPYSNRDMYKIFNDTSTDYFKHGIYIDRQNLTTENGNFVSTPEENNDPVIFGFDLIIDVSTSPLLNGSINEFLQQFADLGEIVSKTTVYNDFKTQFIKLFKTKEKVDIVTSNRHLLNETGKSNINQTANADDPSNVTYGKAAYMSYYLKKVDGLKNLSESNGSGSFKYLTEYRKDTITLSFTEDVSLTLGTLANLYKLLYWSKPNGKSIIPENLLRFNCDIVVSELRNFSRVKASNGRVDVVKDNLSRYVYSLTECQFFFNSRAHADSIDNTSGSTIYDNYDVSFDYKFSTVRFERWNPNISSYVSYNDGAIWDNNGNERVSLMDDGSVIRGIGMDTDFLIKKYVTNPSDFELLPSVNTESTRFEKLKAAGKQAAKNLAKTLGDTTKQAVSREIQNQINKGTSLVNQSLNKALNAVAGTRGIKPPTNVYDNNNGKNALQNSRFFYDIRGNLADFAGNSITGLI